MQIVGYDPRFKEAFIEMNKAWIGQVIQHFELSVPSLHPHYRDFLTTTTRADFLWQTFFRPMGTVTAFKDRIPPSTRPNGISRQSFLV